MRNLTGAQNRIPAMDDIKELTKADHQNSLFKKEYVKLSLRAQNILEDMDIVNYNNACNYYIIHEGNLDFIGLRNVGLKTNAELINFFKELKEYFGSQNEPEEENSTGKKPMPDGSDQTPQNQNTPVFNNKMELEYQKKLNGISTRAKKILKFINADSVKGFYNYFFIKYPTNLDFYIKNCGAISTDEILNFKKTVKKVIDSYSSRSIGSGLFSDLELYYRESEFFNDRLREIFNRCFKIHESDKFDTLGAIGKDINLTKERVRQISVEFPKKILNVLLEITRHGFLDIDQYYKNDYFSVNDAYAKTINTKEGTAFSKHIIGYALRQIIPDDFAYYSVNHKLTEFSGIFYRKDLLWNVPACLDLIRALYINRRKSPAIKIELEKILEQSGFKPDSPDMNVSCLQAKNQLVEIIGLYNKCLPNTTITGVDSSHII